MSPRPTIFISAVSKELKSARQLVANTLQFLGYQPVWQDLFGTEQGDLRTMLRQKIDGCQGVVQLVGKCYGAEPPAPDEQFGRVSYSQYEALYARQQGKKTWYLFLDDDFGTDAHEPELEQVRELQAAYRRRLQSESQLYHPLNSREALEASVLKLRDDLARLRRGVRQWAATVIVLLVVLVGAAIWLSNGQRQENRNLAAMKEEMAKLRLGIEQFPQVQNKIRQERPGQNADAVEQRTYEELAKRLGVDPKLLQEKLPQFARELKNAPNASTYERANAAYVAKDYSEAERLALAAADEAQKASPPKPSDAIEALDGAGYSADARIEYAEALQHFRAAAQLTDRARDPLEWAEQQCNIAYVLGEQGKYAEAETEFRTVIKLVEKVLGTEHPETLSVRSELAAMLGDQGKYAEAESEDRTVIKLQEKVLGPEHPQTLASRGTLAFALYGHGKYAEAEAEVRTAIKLEEKVLGPEDPQTLGDRSALARMLEAQGKYAEAETELRSVIKLQEKVRGPEHPDTLYGRSELATVLVDRGKYAEAETEDRTVIKLQEKVLGPEHPDTLYGRSGLAIVLLAQNKNAEAEAELRTVLKLQEKVLGPEHPDTLGCRQNLATALKGQGNYAEAEAEFRAVIKLQEKVLGPENSNTLSCRASLAAVLYDQGKYAEAETEDRAVIKLEEKVLGSEHPETMLTCYNLALCLKSENKMDEAKEFARRTAEDAHKVLGATHPDTLKYEKFRQDLQTPN